VAGLAAAAFISHGAPTVALEASRFTEALARFGRSLGRPSAVVAISAHWMATPIAVTGAARPDTIHDFSGFGPALEAIRYPCPGEPALAKRVAELAFGEVDARRGLDHGVWVPLRHIFPEANVPVVQVALPARAPVEALVILGRRLAPLRREGIVILGTGGVVHNLRRLDPSNGPPPDWAREFDVWVAKRVRALDLSSLMDYRREAEHAYLAAPTSEHLEPLLTVVGAALPGDRVDDIYEGFQLGTLSLRSFALRG
jgi:4,5-DOPA dioxygenase extradiol